MTAAEFETIYLPNVTVDVVLLSVEPGGSLAVLLGKRSEEPFRGRHTLPGVFVRRDETLEASAARALREKSGVSDLFLEQLFTFGEPGRDPRGRIISVAYYALVAYERFASAVAERADIEAAVVHVPWPGEEGGPVNLRDAGGATLALAFDHAEIIGTTIKRIRGKLRYAPIGYELLPDAFTLSDVQRIHEAVLARRLNKDSFRRSILASGLLEPTGSQTAASAHRPAALYRFRKGD